MVGREVRSRRRLGLVTVLVFAAPLVGLVPAVSAAPTVSLQAVGDPPSVVMTPEATWAFTTDPVAAAGVPELTLTRDDQVVTTYSGTRGADGSVSVRAAGLAPGYYDVEVTFPQAAPWTGALVVADGPVAQDVRIGVDAGLSWSDRDLDYVRRASAMMQAVGIGSARDRFTWTAAQADPPHAAGTTPDCTGWDSKAWNVVGNYYVATTNAMVDAGIDVVTAIHGAPYCARPADSTTGTDAPTNYDAVYDFGQLFGEHIPVGAVEYQNEQVAPFFFKGYPFQYASGFKAFSAGVKSVRPDMLVLPGSDITARPAGSSTMWGVLYQAETLANGTASAFDVRNQHWYGTETQSLVHAFDDTKWAVDAAAGVADRPQWMTEMGYNLKRAGGEPGAAAYVAQTYAIGLAAGYERVYPFYWQSLLEQCPDSGPSNTDTCGALWGLTRNVWSDKWRDGRSQDMSPRPAVAVMAAMARHISGRQVQQVETGPTGATVYFSGGIAVTWDSARQITDFGTGVTVKNMYGRAVDASVSPDSTHPYLLSNVTVVPGTPERVVVPGSPAQPRGAAPLRLEVQRMEVNGVDQVRHTDWDSLVPLAPGDTVRMVVRARSGVTDVAASTAFACEASEGLTVFAQGPTAEGYVCEAQAVQVPVPQLTDLPYQVTHLTVTGRHDGASDTSQIAFSGTGEAYTGPLAHEQNSPPPDTTTQGTTTQGGPGHPLARTGADVAWLLGLLALTLVVGTGLVVVRRRRAES
ncbi:MAG: hypothetical protein FWH11_06870 [Micrococcales bacterium]|nr:hypothetical protein [Micrococcales bacterium]